MNDNNNINIEKLPAPNAPKGKPRFKKPRAQAMEIMFEELKGMIPTVLVCDGIVLAVCVIYSVIAAKYDWRLLTGLLVGNTAALSNFYLSGVKAAKIIQGKDRRKAQTYSTVVFLIKYFGAFAVYGVLLTFNLINVFTGVIPLFYPKIHYTIKAILGKEV